MGREELCSKIEEALSAIDFKGSVKSHERYGNGHINDTFLVICQLENGQEKRYILQRMNQQVFPEPEKLMENICHVTQFLQDKIEKNGGDKARETLGVIPTKDGAAWFQDSIGSYWRAYDFIEEAICYDKAEEEGVFYQSAYAFGKFQSLLADFDASLLHEVIKDFHNTPVRFQRFKQVVAEDSQNRCQNVQPEISFLMEREQDMAVAMNLLQEGKLPLRVTHNDTKLNNVMLDAKTKTGLCVIDLDTVMPGLSIHDFGDSIRFGANNAAEDEKDLSKVYLNMELFEEYAKGFLSGCGDSLWDMELEMLPIGAKMMTMECGMRFLTDYLEGDVYFNTHYPDHNLDRCRTQLKLVADMEAKMAAMKAVVKKIKETM